LPVPFFVAAAALPPAAAAASAAAPGCCPLMFMPLNLALILDINSVSSQYLQGGGWSGGGGRGEEEA
jgi:hypothetical protein